MAVNSATFQESLFRGAREASHVNGSLGRKSSFAMQWRHLSLSLSLNDKSKEWLMQQHTFGNDDWESILYTHEKGLINIINYNSQNIKRKNKYRYWISYCYQTCVFSVVAKVLLGVFHGYQMLCLCAPKIKKQNIYEFSAAQGTIYMYKPSIMLRSLLNYLKFLYSINHTWIA
jgi:hypothetical protein